MQYNEKHKRDIRSEKIGQNIHPPKSSFLALIINTGPLRPFEVTLDNFGFPVGGRLGAWRAVFRPRLPKVALFGSGRVFIASTPNFGPSLTKLVGTIRFTKKMTHNDNGAGPGRIYGETAVFTFCRKAENGPKIRFFPKKIPKFAKRLIFIWEKGTFFF